ADIFPAVGSRWAELALAVPTWHDNPAAAAEALDEGIAAAPEVEPGTGTMDLASARLLALDVLLVEAFVRVRGVALGATAAAKLARAARGVARRLDVPPVLSYPLYVLANPGAAPEGRQFTATDDEARFIRLHREVEERCEAVIGVLKGVLAATDMAAALAEVGNDIVAHLRVASRTIGAFRSEAQVRRAVFRDDIRPYFGPVTDAATGDVLHHGPSGLQSPAFRILAMQMGYRDEVLDRSTRGVIAYQEAATRRRMEGALAHRDAGQSLTRLDEEAFGHAAVPHLHPAHGADAQALLRLAEASGAVAASIGGDLDRLGIRLGAWPAGAPAPGPRALPAVRAPGTLRNRRGLEAAVRVEAAFFAFHVEHVLTAAHHIGVVAGTGGTSGVEYLLLSTFRRGLPRLWRSGVGQTLAEGLATAGRGGPGGP
ncbi:MAG: hypothetical protein ACE5EL_04510, partial [Anaerolineae bacterium]